MIQRVYKSTFEDREDDLVIVMTVYISSPFAWLHSLSNQADGLPHEMWSLIFRVTSLITLV